jgi:hypothetical protein
MLTLLPSEQVRTDNELPPGCLPCNVVATSNPHVVLLAVVRACVRAGQEPNEDSYTQQLEARVQTLEKDIKAMREAFGGEIKSLREALRPTTEKCPPDSSRYATTNCNVDQSNSLCANPPVQDQAVTSMQEAFELVRDVWRAFLKESNARHDLDKSIGVVDDPSRHGLTMEEAEYRVLVNKEKFEENSRILPAMVTSTKDRMAELREAVGGNGEASDSVHQDTPVTAIGKVCSLLDDFERDMKTNEDPKLLREKTMELCNNLDWCKVRLQRAQRASEKTGGPSSSSSSSPQAASRPGPLISP